MRRRFKGAVQRTPRIVCLGLGSRTQARLEGLAGADYVGKTPSRSSGRRVPCRRGGHTERRAAGARRRFPPSHLLPPFPRVSAGNCACRRSDTHLHTLQSPLGILPRLPNTSDIRRRPRPAFLPSRKRWPEPRALVNIWVPDREHVGKRG